MNYILIVSLLVFSGCAGKRAYDNCSQGAQPGTEQYYRCMLDR
jgi:hypothetical protein